MLITSFKRDSDLYNVDNNPFWFNEPPTLDHWHYIFARTPFLKWLCNTATRRRCGRHHHPPHRLARGLQFVPLFRPLGRASRYRDLSRVSRAPYAAVHSDGPSRQRPGNSKYVVVPHSRVPDYHHSVLHMAPYGLHQVHPPGSGRGSPHRRLQPGERFRRIVMPLVVPGIVTVTIFTFTLSAQEFVYALTFVTSTAVKTVSVGVPSDMVRGDVFFWGPLMGSAFLASVPIAVSVLPRAGPVHFRLHHRRRH